MNDEFLSALESRHLESLTFTEVRRALSALSRVYVQKRDKLSRGAVFDGAGKRAAFALVYGPLHYRMAEHVLRELSSELGPARRILDLGCGTGTVGAAWALLSGAEVWGVDKSRWAAAEADWTYRALGVRGRATVGDVARVRLSADTLVLGYVVNELEDKTRDALLARLLRHRGQVLVLEPISKRVTPWWSAWAREFQGYGGRADEWTLEVERSEFVRRMDQATRLDHRRVKSRTLYRPPNFS